MGRAFSVSALQIAGICMLLSLGVNGWTGRKILAGSNHTHSLMKRQSGPTCRGPYQFSVSASATSGTSLGVVSSSQSNGATLWYTIPDNGYNQYFSINPYTGALTTSPNFNSGYVNGRSSLQFNVQTTDVNGGTCMSSVTVSVSPGSSIASNFGSGNFGGGFGGGNTGCPIGYYPYNGLCYSTNWNNNNDNSGISTSYSFTTLACTAGTAVGTVSLNSANRYSVSSSNFLITNAGAITLNGAIAAGTYYLTISGYTYSGGYLSTTVTVIVKCKWRKQHQHIRTFVSTTYSSVVPGFNATSYNFVTSSCASGATVGSVGATNAVGYVINYGSSNFAISSAGAITLAQALTAGVYSVTAAANSNGGFSQAVPITVTVVCATG
ncbi:hypothetical protein BV898_10928 [Hypsibius exemplaris]|uniref:Cadherin domain-containing protein n=1 Tax=Hypsibius exemplaris TaxID=2072580 RepID=A0A1W0WI79_HYPEX|nr:hypothetical protein BV898_10928 [Hypsibius exemplaris]